MIRYIKTFDVHIHTFVIYKRIGGYVNCWGS